MPQKTFLVPGILDALEQSIAIRRQLHAHPELGFEEHATSSLVAEKLREYGYVVHTGLGGTGVVGSLKKGSGARRLGLRADMDALPIQEQTGLPYASQVAGKMHACGHDGHTASLLAAARHLAEEGNFNGTLNLIFQPAEEGQGGAKRMLADGLFERFPCDAIFAFHNMPGFPVGKIGTLPGRFMSSSDTVVITITGRGGHGSMPHTTVDATVVAAYIVVALQSVVSRSIDPRQMAVVSVGSLHAGNAANIIAQTAQLQLSVRSYSPEVRQQLHDRIVQIVKMQGEAFGAQVDIDYQWCFPSLHNDPRMTDFVLDAAREWLGEEEIIPGLDPLTGSEEFSFMLEKCPGCYFVVGNGLVEDSGCMVHNPGYDFNDGIIPVAASFWVRLTERFLA